MSENKNDSIPPLLINQNIYAYSDEENVEMLNRYFCSIANIDETNAVLPNIEPKTDTSISHINIQQHEIENVIKELPTNKACLIAF
jgi:hypothetical protein